LALLGIVQVAELPGCRSLRRTAAQFGRPFLVEIPRKPFGLAAGLKAGLIESELSKDSGTKRFGSFLKDLARFVEP
jgi:hypothetical protein